MGSILFLCTGLWKHVFHFLCYLKYFYHIMYPDITYAAIEGPCQGFLCFAFGKAIHQSTKLNLCYTHSQCTRSLSASLLIATAAKLHTVGEQLCLLAKEFTGITCEEKAAKQLGDAYQRHRLVMNRIHDR